MGDQSPGRSPEGRLVPLNSRLPQIAAMLRPKLEAIVEDTAERVVEDARNRAPVRSGDLRRAIHVEQKDDLTAHVVAGDKDVFYGHMVEYGTSHSAPHPFLIPALEANREDAIRRARRALGGI
jgi:HK97 gp10 family phage protein